MYSLTPTYDLDSIGIQVARPEIKVGHVFKYSDGTYYYGHLGVDTTSTESMYFSLKIAKFDSPSAVTLATTPSSSQRMNNSVIIKGYFSFNIKMHETPMLPGRTYQLRLGSMAVNAQVTEIKHSVNVNTLERMAAKSLDLNDVAFCNLSVDQAIPFDPYSDNRTMGAFILVDLMHNATVGCGMIDFALRRAANIHHHAMTVTQNTRAAAKQQKPCVLWFTGLSGAGKSTIADLVEQRLHDFGHHTMLLDGDNVRFGLNRDLGFSDEDRVENIRRVGEVSKLLVEAGLITLVSFISPFRSERQLARNLLQDDEFFEVFVDAPLAVCEQRDPKGLYKKARAGEIPNFTGIGSDYEPPENPELHLSASVFSAEQLAEQVITLLRNQGIIAAE